MFTELAALLNFSDDTLTVEVPTAWSAPVHDHGPPYPEPLSVRATWASASIVLTLMFVPDFCISTAM